MSDAVGPAGDPVPLHRRSIEYEAFDAGDAVTIVGRLRDTRPWVGDGEPVPTVHDMALQVTVGVPDLTITEAGAVMDTFPHAECPGITAAFDGLVGLSVARGYTRQVQARFGGVRGCTHLEQLARALGPVVIQAVTSKRALAAHRGASEAIMSPTGTPWARDSCHVWAEDGPAEQKLAAGWLPGKGTYPAPPVRVFLSPGGSS
jgi:hypothetical protein